MTLEEALATVMFTRDDIKRVIPERLEEVIAGVEAEAQRFPYDAKPKKRAEAYKMI